MEIIKRANAAYSAGDYAQAVTLYNQAMRDQPELARLYQFNLDRARTKAQLSSHPESTSGLATQRGSSNPEPNTRSTLDTLYAQVEAHIRNTETVDIGPKPLVSVLMTAHNVASYIEAAVTSVMRQTWPNMELIVVDDASTDETWTILTRLQQAFSGLRCYRLNTNLGTYFAKNYALTRSQGTYIFFQDGDDLCHPERIRLCMRELMQDRVVCVRASYSRVLYPSEEVFPVNGLIHKLGLITLGLRRSVFEDIGFFNCTTKASDDEFFHRLSAWIGKKGGEIRDLDVPLYFNTLRDNSLFSDMIVNDPIAERRIEQRPSASRGKYVAAFRKKHAEIGVDNFKSFFSYPLVRDLIEVAPDMTALPNPSIPVVVSLCSIPERSALLRKTLVSLAPQVDKINIYLDRYTTVPEFIKSTHKNISVVLSQDKPGLRDNGKFLPFSDLDGPCYYFTADDDIVYPPDYVATLLRRIELYGREAVIGVHGVLIPERPTGYFSGFRKVLMYKNALERDALVSNLGTGTVAFYSGCLGGLSLDMFPTAGMADIYLSLYCKNHNIPMIAVARPENWLQELQSPNTSLYQEFVKDDLTQQVAVTAAAPWGYSAIRKATTEAINKINDRHTVERLSALVPQLSAALK